MREVGSESTIEGADTTGVLSSGVPGRAPSVLSAVADLWGRFGVVGVLIALIVFFTIKNSTTFPTVANAQTIAGDNSILMVAALAGLLPLIVGEFDLSIGNMLGLSSVILGNLSSHHNMGLWPALAITLAVGLAAGITNGLLITQFGISSFIATLGMGTILGGIVLYISGGEIIYTGLPQGLLTFAQNLWFGVPRVTWVAIAMILAIWYLAEHTPTGRRLYAVGMGRDAARLSGVRPKPLIVAAFAFSGTMSALAGALELGRVGAAHPEIGPEFLLPALAAAFLGATTIRPGRFNVIGTTVAVILVAVGITGLQLNGAPFWVEPIFNGGILVLAVGLSRVAASRNRRVVGA